MPSIFISYRRSDRQDVAGRIYDRLAQHFGREAIFKDVDDIPGGEDFRQFLRDTLQQCKVVLAIIGPDWVNAPDDRGGRRLDNPADWVRLGIEESLNRDDVLVVPVLVSNAAMPRPNELPDGMKDLVYRNYRQARPDPDFHKDVGRLIIDLERHVEQTRPAASPPAIDVDTSQQRLDNYRNMVRQYLQADNGDLTPISRGILDGLRHHFGLTDTEAEAVEAEEQQPYLKKAEAIDNYRKVFAETLQHEYPLSEGTLRRLQEFQKLLELNEHEVEKTEAPLRKAAKERRQEREKAEYGVKLDLYQVKFENVIQEKYPISESVGSDLESWQKELGLKSEDVERIEQPIREAAEARYQQVLKEAERQRQEAEATRQQEEAVESERRQAAKAERRHQAAENVARQRESEVKKQQEAEELSSERFGANYYAKLQELLAAQDWKAADEETTRCMCKVMNRQQEGWLRIKDIEQFPCQDLRNIDRLWVKHSHGRFGFSVQNQIWLDCGSPTQFNNDWKKFGETVGWRTREGFLKQAKWLSYSQMIFELTAPRGHLPRLVWGGGWGLVRGIGDSSLASRLVKCKIL